MISYLSIATCKAQIVEMLLVATGYPKETCAGLQKSITFVQHFFGALYSSKTKEANNLLCSVKLMFTALGLRDSDFAKHKEMIDAELPIIYKYVLEVGGEDTSHKRAQFVRECRAFMGEFETKLEVAKHTLRDFVTEQISALKNYVFPVFDDMNVADYTKSLADKIVAVGIGNAEIGVTEAEKVSLMFDELPSNFVGQSYSEGKALVFTAMSALCTSTILKQLASKSAAKGLDAMVGKIQESVEVARTHGLNIPPTVQVKAAEFIQVHSKAAKEANEGKDPKVAAKSKARSSKE
jgi:hypothetical protein